MKHQINILDTVIERLKGLNEPCLGKLFGIISNKALFILGLQLDNNSEIIHSYSLPTEVDFCGVFEAYSGNYDSEKVLTNSSNIEVTDNPIFLAVKLTIQNDIQCNIICNNKINKENFITVTKQEIYSQIVHVRLRGNFKIYSEPDCNSVSEQFSLLRKTVTSGMMAFNVPKANILLMASDSKSGVIGISGDSSIDQLCPAKTEEGKQKKNHQIFSLEVINLELAKKLSENNMNEDSFNHAPVVMLNKDPITLLRIPIKIDFLSAITRDTKLSKVYNILLESTIKGLKLNENRILKHIERLKASEKFTSPKILHFFPKECGHFITRVIFDDSEEELKKERELLHDTLLLSKHTPMFRNGNQFQFPHNKSENKPLLNVHEGVKPTNNGGKIVLVKGNYEYYHYCQNRMDDNGWGCAYRSLQTLASWFRQQGYTERDVPTFKDIQKCLVDIGDKPSNFIDSRQWIGSTEVNYVLNSLLGITCKILYVSSGEEMSTMGPELVNHFEVHGSPIMIGGGVLAHTILGVDYNRDTGSLKFLILDPHYTGGEDLTVIQNKGWCGWKGVDFWNKTAYYNMCLPQVPREV